MMPAIERYLALRRAAGFRLSNAEYLLGSFARFAATRNNTHVRAETAIACDPNGSDDAVERFARWLPRARQELEAARLHLERLQAETARARAEVAMCRAALDPAGATMEAAPSQ